MDTRKLLWLLSASACLLGFMESMRAAERPNIVFILIDDLRYDTFGFMGHPFVETPYIDALAKGGVQFSNAFVTTSLCSPARASFLTGQYMHNHKVIDNNDRMPTGTVTFPQRLQSSGYETAFIGKWHMGGSSDEARPGFDHWVSFRGQGTYAAEKQSLNVDGNHVPRTKYMTDELTDYAEQWLRKRTSDGPFLLYLSHKGVHGLYDPAPRHRDRYKDVAVTAPPSTTSTTDAEQGTPMWVRDQRNSWHGVEFPYYGRSNQTIAQMYRHYCEMILSIDDSVGRVMQLLREQGRQENTLVVFTSDGGHLWGEHGLIDKRCAYEESMRIPLLAYGPSLVNPGTRCDALVANIDVAPTLLELAGVASPSRLDGRSFAKLLRNPDITDSTRQDLLYEYYWEHNFPQTPTTFALRTRRHKLIQYHGIWDTDELYDIAEDPHETTNLIHQPEDQKLITQMRQQLHARLEKTGGLVIPLGNKRGHGNNQRSPSGSKRSEFPNQMIRGSEKSASWKSLFDGKTLTGWELKNGTAKYEVKEGTIIGTTVEGSWNSFLCSKREYGDFELEFEVRVHDRLNSGVQIRSKTRQHSIGKGPNRAAGRVIGPQVEIESSRENGAEAGYIYSEASGLGWLTPKERLIPHKHFKDGEWNHYRIVAKGARIQTWINGRPVEDLTDESTFEQFPRGFIGLQVHRIKAGAGPYRVAWRNLRIKKL